MKAQTAYYLYGNWNAINGYLGEPQKTLMLLLQYLRKGNSAESVRSIHDIPQTNGPYVVLIFGDFFMVVLRTLVCMLHGIPFSHISYIPFKEKTSMSDVGYFLKNIDSFWKAWYLFSIPLAEIFLPQKFYDSMLQYYSKKMFCVCYPARNFDKQKILLCSVLEKNKVKKIVVAKNKRFTKETISLLYFGRDSYLRGVDALIGLEGTRHGYGYRSTGIFPFKGYLSQSGLNSNQFIYSNTNKILGHVKHATFTLFLFRTKLGGPDIPAALIESFLLGVPPIISRPLVFDILARYKYPLVLDHISPTGVMDIVEKTVKNNTDYQRLIRLCFWIRKDLVNNYSYDFSRIIN